MNSLALTPTKRIALIGVAALAASALAMGIQPAGAGDTDVTFTLTAGTLSVAETNAAVDLGTVGEVVAQTVTGSLGNVTVTDNRGAAIVAWTASVASTDFTNGTTTIDGDATVYTTGLVTQDSGTAVGVPVVTVVGTKTAPVAVVVATGSGSNQSTWTPTVSVVVPPNATVGTYTATITHSISGV